MGWVFHEQAPKRGIGRKEKSASRANGGRYGGDKNRKEARVLAARKKKNLFWLYNWQAYDRKNLSTIRVGVLQSKFQIFLFSLFSILVPESSAVTVLTVLSVRPKLFLNQESMSQNVCFQFQGQTVIGTVYRKSQA